MIRLHRLPSTACLAMLLSLVLSAPAQAGEAQRQRQLQVVGEGEAFLAPDMATLQLTVTREAESAREALNASSSAMQKVLEVLREEGVAERDLRTRQFNIQPRYRHPSRKQDGSQGPPSIEGYQVSNSLEVRIREIDRVGAILDRAVTLGVNQDGQIALGNADPSDALDAARTAAVKDAMDRARTLAEAAGVELGKILQITEQGGAPEPMPAMFRREAMSASFDSVPVATGENAYRVSVALRIALED